MPPKAFEFYHIIAIGIAVALVIFLRKMALKESNRFIRFTASSIMGVLIGGLASYILAHIATPIIRIAVPYTTAGPDGYHFLFWALYVSLTFITLILGALLGLGYAKKLDEGQKPSSGSERPKRVKDLDSCLDQLEQCNARKDPGNEDV